MGVHRRELRVRAARDLTGECSAGCGTRDRDGNDCRSNPRLESIHYYSLILQNRVGPTARRWTADVDTPVTSDHIRRTSALDAPTAAKVMPLRAVSGAG